MNCKMMLQIHDELVLEVEDSVLDDFVAVVIDCMRHPVDGFTIPLELAMYAAAVCVSDTMSLSFFRRRSGSWVSAGAPSPPSIVMSGSRKLLLIDLFPR